MKVLIAGDNLLNHALMGKYLRTLTWEHTTVASGLLDVEACRPVDFDVILMDIEMPELIGIKAVRNIRNFMLLFQK